MNILLEIFNNLVLNESISVNSITDSIKNRYRVVINYEGDPSHGIAPGIRTIEVYAYGLTKAGNPVIRAYQPYGDTATKVPNWKFFRIDRIKTWKPTYQLVTRPASGFNPNGDRSMSVVYSIANFDETPNISNMTGPKQTPKVIGQLDNIEKILADREKEKITKQQQTKQSLTRKQLDTKTTEPIIQSLKQNNSQTIQEPEIKGIEQKNDTFKPEGELSQLDKIKDLSRRLDQANKIELDTKQKVEPKSKEIEPEIKGIEQKNDTFKPEGELSQLDKIKDLSRRLDQSRKIDLNSIPKK